MRSIKLPIKLECDFCASKRLDHIYTPIRSARGMEVFVCDHCGLLQSFSTLSYQSSPKGSMSADADRSSYRYTKDIISDRYEKCFKGFVNFTQIIKVLDVGSNRGAFINYLELNYPGKQITGIEPNCSVTDAYSLLSNVSLQACRFEHSQLPEDYYDFAYCAHTLEHANSAREMLLGVRRALKPEGLFFVSVPNIMFHDDLIEELFIDPHTFHFNFNLLRSFFLQMGFSIVYEGGPEEADIIFLLKKKEFYSQQIEFHPTDLEFSKVVRNKVADYQVFILQNRENLKESVERLRSAAKTHKVVIWGGGRIFDALVRFGGLDLTTIYLVVDKFLFKYVEKLHGINLKSPDVLKTEDPSTILVYIASRDYADEIRAEASSLNIVHFVQFGENP